MFLLIDNEKCNRQDRNPWNHRGGDHVGTELLHEKLLQRSRVVGWHANYLTQSTAGRSSQDHI